MLEYPCIDRRQDITRKLVREDAEMLLILNLRGVYAVLIATYLILNDRFIDKASVNDIIFIFLTLEKLIAL